MGYDLRAYVDVDQTKMDYVIKFYRFDKFKFVDSSQIAKKYKMLYIPELAKTGFQMELSYHFDEACQIHEMYYSVGTNFIRDDERFENRRYQYHVLEQKFGERFPNKLCTMNHTIHNDDNAREAAEALEKWFSEDEHLLNFSKWLRETSRVCNIYELSR